MIIGGFIGGSIIFIFANNIVKIFINDIQIVKYGTTMLRALMISTPIIGIVHVLGNLFQAMGKGTQSMILEVGRQGLIFIPVLYVMSKIAGLQGVIISQAITDALTAILAILMFMHIKRQENINLNKDIIVEV